MAILDQMVLLCFSSIRMVHFHTCIPVTDLIFLFFFLAVNKQLNDKERVAAALENPNLRQLVDECLYSNEL